MNLVGNRMANDIEKPAAAMNMPPALKHDAFGVFTDKKELLKIRVRNIGKIVRPHDMGLAFAMKLNLRQFLFAVGAIDLKHGVLSNAQQRLRQLRRSGGHCETVPA